jgi:hypothetical protein
LQCDGDEKYSTYKNLSNIYKRKTLTLNQVTLNQVTQTTQNLKDKLRYVPSKYGIKIQRLCLKECKKSIVSTGNLDLVIPNTGTSEVCSFQISRIPSINKRAIMTLDRSLDPLNSSKQLPRQAFWPRFMTGE